MQEGPHKIAVEYKATNTTFVVTSFRPLSDAEARAAVAALGTGAVAGTGPPAASVEPAPDDLGDLSSIVDPVDMGQEISQMVLADSRGAKVKGLEDVRQAATEEDLTDA